RGGMGCTRRCLPARARALDRRGGCPGLGRPSTTGARVFQWMDGREQARIERHRGSAPIVAFCGTQDNVVGWGEKVGYFQAMQAQNAGGTWYWDERDHYTPHDQTEWYPMMNARLLYKYRVDQSYPAFTNC